MKIQEEDPGLEDIRLLLIDHLADMRAHSPAESVHALDIDGLKADGIHFWTLREHGRLLGCGALKSLGKDGAEIKSMKTARSHLRKGVAARMLQHIIEYARENSISSLYLETGSPDVFIPARQLYSRFGFTERGPFGDYELDPYSIFMQLDL